MLGSPLKKWLKTIARYLINDRANSKTGRIHRAESTKGGRRLRVGKQNGGCSSDIPRGLRLAVHASSRVLPYEVRLEA